ncbi:MAG: hypothetical protein GY853_13890 [PVC group bacterium]|nr:hypothetical protein [PVC group bacterium]
MPQIPTLRVPDIGGAIQRSGQIAGNVISSIPGLKQQADEQERQRSLFEQAANAAKQDWRQMETAYKGIKETLTEQLQPLVDQGLMSEEERETSLKRFRMPLSADQKDPVKYMTELNSVVKEISADASSRIEKGKQQKSQGQASEFVESRIAGSRRRPVVEPVGPEQETGRGFTEQDIQSTGFMRPAVPPAQFQEDLTGGTPEEFTPGQQKMVAESPKTLSLPTRLEDQKRKMEERKQTDLERHRRVMEGKGYSADTMKQSTAKFKILLDGREDSSGKEIQLTDKKRSALSLLNRVQKGEQLKEQEIAKAEFYGIDTQSALEGGQELAVQLKNVIKKIDAQIKAQNKISKDIENTIVEIADDPNIDLPNALIQGQKTVFPDQPERQLSRPPALGGTAQIGKGVAPAVEAPGAATAPTREEIIKILEEKGLSAQEINEYLFYRGMKGGVR